MDVDGVREVLDEFVEEQAILLGGILVSHRIEDEAVWALVQGIESIRDRFLRRLQSEVSKPRTVPDRLRTDPHPAVEHLLAVVDRGQTQ